MTDALTIGQTRQIDYQNYRFGRSKQRFRGPIPDLNQPYIAFIGGSETYGKFIPDPFPAQVTEALGVPCANWGTPGGGPSFFLKDPVVLEACSNALACVITVMGAVSMSNRLYTVFKRRNARLRDTSRMLRALYPDMNLGEFRFAHNMLYRMSQSNPTNFKAVEIEMQEAWVARMRELMEDIETARVLLWMSTRTPEEVPDPSSREAFMTPPAFVNREMIEAIAPYADIVVEYVPNEGLGQDFDAIPDPDFTGPDASLRHPSQIMHDQVSEVLVGPLREIVSIKQSGAVPTA